jgi:hypothetical protein
MKILFCGSSCWATVGPPEDGLLTLNLMVNLFQSPMLILAGLLLLGPIARGQQTDTQHAFEASMPVSRKLQLTLHSRGRTNPGGLGPYQFRLGPIVEYSLGPRWSLLGGYYFAKQKSAERDLRGTHRPFGGVEFMAFKSAKSEVEMRSLVERFFAYDRSFTRFRQRLRWSGTAPVAPYAGVETFLDRQGIRSTRYSGGVRWAKVRRRIDLDLGYFYEPRRPDLGASRHMFLTSLHFRFGGLKRRDPDI